jgi:hypothetical protein
MSSFFIGCDFPIFQEDVLGVASSSDEEETLKMSKKKKLKKARLDAEPLPPLDNELEDEKEGDDEEENLEWGKKRSAYYNADYVDEEWDGRLYFDYKMHLLLSATVITIKIF